MRLFYTSSVVRRSSKIFPQQKLRTDPWSLPLNTSSCAVRGEAVNRTRPANHSFPFILDLPLLRQRRPRLPPQPPTSSGPNFHLFYQHPTARTIKRRSRSDFAAVVCWRQRFGSLTSPQYYQVEEWT